MNTRPADEATMPATEFDALERAAGLDRFTLDEDSRHRIEWALFWARTNNQAKEGGKVEIANLIVELAVQFPRAACASALAPENAAAPKPAGRGNDIVASDAFVRFVRQAVSLVLEPGRLSDAALDREIRRALSAARRQKDDPKSRLPPERREELARALAK